MRRYQIAGFGVGCSVNGDRLMRLFLAIDMPQEVRDLLSGLQRHIKGGRPVPEENMHLTLAFLGESVANDFAEDLHHALEAKRFRLPRLVIGGVGSFGAASPKAIWIGAGPKAELEDLHGRLAHIARRIGFALPKRRYQPKSESRSP